MAVASVPVSVAPIPLALGLRRMRRRLHQIGRTAAAMVLVPVSVSVVSTSHVLTVITVAAGWTDGGSGFGISAGVEGDHPTGVRPPLHATTAASV